MGTVAEDKNIIPAAGQHWEGRWTKNLYEITKVIGGYVHMTTIKNGSTVKPHDTSTRKSQLHEGFSFVAEREVKVGMTFKGRFSGRLYKITEIKDNWAYLSYTSPVTGEVFTNSCPLGLIWTTYDFVEIPAEKISVEVDQVWKCISSTTKIKILYVTDKGKALVEGPDSTYLLSTDTIFKYWELYVPESEKLPEGVTRINLANDPKTSSSEDVVTLSEENTSWSDSKLKAVTNASGGDILLIADAASIKNGYFSIYVTKEQLNFLVAERERADADLEFDA